MKLYVIVRGDLPPGAQVAQACHGLRAFAEGYPEIDRAWYDGSNNLIVLSVPDLAELESLRCRAQEASVPVTAFCEPDFDDELTAIAIAPDGARLVSSLPLALRAAS